MDLIDADEINCKTPDHIDDTDLFAQYYVGDAVTRGGGINLSKTVASGGALEKILSSTGSKPVWCDYDASIRITHGYLKEKYRGNLSDKDRKIINHSSIVAKDMCVLRLAACRMGSTVTDVIKGHITTPAEAGGSWGIAWNRGMVRSKSFTPEVIRSHDQFDFSSMDQVHQVSKMWERFYRYAANYRLTGNGACVREVNCNIIDSLKGWIITALESTNFTDKLARKYLCVPRVSLLRRSAKVLLLYISFLANGSNRCCTSTSVRFLSGKSVTIFTHLRHYRHKVSAVLRIL